MSRFPLLKPLRTSAEVVTIASAWFAWIQGNMNSYTIATTMVDDTTPNDITKKYGHRFPVNQSGTQFLYMAGTGVQATDQANTDAVLKYAIDAGIDCICWLWYPSANLITSGSPTLVSAIWAAFDRYMSSQYKSQIKFCFSIQSDWGAYPAGSWSNFTNNFVPYFVSMAQDTQYLRVGATQRPVFYMYQSSVTGWDSTHSDELRDAIIAGGMATPAYTQNNNSATVANTIGAYGIATYGPQGAQPAGTGQIAYSAQITKDRANFSSPTTNAKRVVTITHGFDGRCVAGRGEDSWYGDTPTYTEWESQLRLAYQMVRTRYDVCTDALLHIHSIGEWGENGTFLPSAQTVSRGVNGTSQGPILDAIYNTIHAQFPSAYTDCYHAKSLHAAIVRVGTWAEQSPVVGASGGATAAFEYAEIRSSTLNDTATFTPAGNTTRIRVYGGNGALYGTFNIKLDGGSNILITQTSVTETRNTLLYDSGVLTAGSHNVVCTVVTGCWIDEFKADVSR